MHGAYVSGGMFHTLGVVPAMRLSGQSPQSALAEQSRGPVDSAAQTWIRRTLVVVEDLPRDPALLETVRAECVYAPPVRLEPGQSACAAFTTLVAETREKLFELTGRYHDPHSAQRALDLAWTSAQVELRELGITPTEAGVFQELAGRLFYPSPDLRAPQEERHSYYYRA